jgi:hypothetical protein
MLADAIQSAGTIMFIMAVALASGRWMTIPEPASLLKFALDVQFRRFHSGRSDAF